MKLILAAIILISGPLAFADLIAYGMRNCQLLSESRAELKGSEICVEEARCEKYSLAVGVPASTIVQVKGYCKEAKSGRCPSNAQTCVDDPSITDSDIKMIKPIHNRGSDSTCEAQGLSDDSSTPEAAPWGRQLGRPQVTKGSQ